MNHSVHHVPGRLRVRSDAFRCRPAEVRNVQYRLASMAGVNQVRCNAHAGSITVYYDPAQLTRESLLEEIRDLGCARTTSTATTTLATTAGALFGKALVGAVINKAVERSAFRLVSVLL